MKHVPKLAPTQQKRFFAKVHPQPNGCWEWQGATRGPYGTVKIHHEFYRAHRVSYRIYKGRIPKGLHVLHSCDNPLCVRPSHLRTGTNADNMQDKADRGRVKGERNHMSKLTEAHVREIRAAHADGVSPIALSKQFGVAPTTARKIVSNISWTHVH